MPELRDDELGPVDCSGLRGQCGFIGCVRLRRKHNINYHQPAAIIIDAHDHSAGRHNPQRNQLGRCRCAKFYVAGDWHGIYIGNYTSMERGRYSDAVWQQDRAIRHRCRNIGCIAWNSQHRRLRFSVQCNIERSALRHRLPSSRKCWRGPDDYSCS
jgi:hypothetical protein